MDSQRDCVVSHLHLQTLLSLGLRKGLRLPFVSHDHRRLKAYKYQRTENAYWKAIRNVHEINFKEMD